MRPLVPVCRGRYLKPPTTRGAPRFTEKVCGIGGAAPCHCVCQKLPGSPSIALRAGARIVSAPVVDIPAVKPIVTPPISGRVMKLRSMMLTTLGSVILSGNTLSRP